MHDFIITHSVERDADAVIRRFRGDPAQWLPRPLTEHGAHEFRADVAAWWRIKVTFAVGDVWQRGNSYTRRLVISTSADQGLSMFSTVAGELTLLDRLGTATLRYNAKAHPRRGRLMRLLPFTAQARAASLQVLSAVAEHLAEQSASALRRP